MRSINCLVILSLVLIIGCKNDKPSLKIGLFDISKNDKNILFSFSKNGKISIASIDLDGGNLRPIIKSTADSNYYNPRFSPDGLKILFIGSKRSSVGGCSIFLANTDGSNKKEILKDTGEIIEAVFSDCEDKIYYIKSKGVGHSSPLARNQPHNSDVYSLNLIGGKIDQITHSESYNMYRISEYDCGWITLNMPGSDKKGLVMFAEKSPNHIIDINPLDNPRKDNSFYNTAFYSKKYKVIGFLAPYELYIMNMKDRISKLLLYDDDMVKYFRFYANQQSIVYINQKDLSFYIVDFEGKKIREIDIASVFE